MTLDGNQVPMDALDHARALMAGIEAHPNDRAALDAVRDVLTRMDEVAAEAPIPWTTWAEHPDPPPQRRWLVRDWLPAGRVALLTGPGGVGKSRLVLQLAAGIASGGGQGDAWIDTPDTDTLRLGSASRSEGDCVVYASWEDEPEEIYRRLAQVSGDGAPWVTPDRLRDLHLVDMAGMGPIWGAGRRTPHIDHRRDHPGRAEAPAPLRGARGQAAHPGPPGRGLRRRRERERPGEGLRRGLGRLGPGQRLRGHPGGPPAQERRHIRRIDRLAGRGPGHVDAGQGQTRGEDG